MSLVTVFIFPQIELKSISLRLHFQNTYIFFDLTNQLHCENIGAIFINFMLMVKI
jgi:hypothetical protein